MSISTYVAVRSALAIALLGSAALARADLVAHFDDLFEGDIFTTFTDGGIRFYDVSRHQGGFTNFAIEDASTGFPSGNFSPPNTLGFGGYVPGPDYAFGAFGAMWFTSDTEAIGAGLDIWTLPLDTGGNTLTLTGYMDDVVVNSVSHTFENSFVPLHFRLDLPEGEYNLFSLTSTGPSMFGDSFMLVDNVSVKAVPRTETICATSTVIQFGSLVSGDVGDTCISDDVRMTVRNGNVFVITQSPITVEFNGGVTTILDPTEVKMTCENRVSLGGLTVRLDMRNYTADASWEQVDERGGTVGFDTVVTVTKTTNADDYVGPAGEVANRIRVRDDTPAFLASWTASVDAFYSKVTS